MDEVMKMETKQNSGEVYILTNPAFPDYVKIGYTNDLEARLAQLNRSECVPFAFQIYATYEVDAALEDSALHAMIERLHPKVRAIETFEGRACAKEFYAMSPEDAYLMLEYVAALSGTTDRLRRAILGGYELLDETLAEVIEAEALRGCRRCW